MTLKIALHVSCILAMLAHASMAVADSSKTTGMLNCKMNKAQPYFPCPFVSLREGAGAAKVEITFPDGTLRTITYKDGKVASTDGGTNFTVEKIEDLSIIRIGNESYEIVDAVPFGG